MSSQVVSRAESPGERIYHGYQESYAQAPRMSRTEKQQIGFPWGATLPAHLLFSFPWQIQELTAVD